MLIAFLYAALKCFAEDQCQPMLKADDKSVHMLIAYTQTVLLKISRSPLSKVSPFAEADDMP